MTLARTLGRRRPRVTFVGRRGRAELRTYYSAADVFVTTPWYEPFGITPVEAMACGTPVVGADVGGIRFSVLDGETGYLVPPRDPDAVAERVARIVADPVLHERLSRQAIARAERLFTWEKVDGLVGGRLPRRAPSTRRPYRRSAARAASMPARGPRPPAAVVDAGFAGAIAALQATPAGAGRRDRRDRRAADRAASSGVASCWSAATAAARPRRSISPPSSSGGFVRRPARRCRPSRSPRTASR